VEAIEGRREESAVSRLLYLAALRRLREEVEEHSAYTNASGGHCVRNRATFIHVPSSSSPVLPHRSSSLSPPLPRLTTVSVPRGEASKEHERKRDRRRENETRRERAGWKTGEFGGAGDLAD